MFWTFIHLPVDLFHVLPPQKIQLSRVAHLDSKRTTSTQAKRCSELLLLLGQVMVAGHSSLLLPHSCLAVHCRLTDQYNSSWRQTPPVLTTTTVLSSKTLYLNTEFSSMTLYLYN